jgi:hypothetical protein
MAKGRGKKELVLLTEPSGAVAVASLDLELRGTYWIMGMRMEEDLRHGAQPSGQTQAQY